jgi:hypothetical protein
LKKNVFFFTSKDPLFACLEFEEQSQEI